MATNKQRIENLEVSLGVLQDSLNRVESGINDKLQQLESAISKVSDLLIACTDPSFSASKDRRGSSNGRFREIVETWKPFFNSQLAKLEFPRYASDDPT